MTSATENEAIAIRWLMRRESADWTQACHAELEAWLEADPARKVTFWRIEHGWTKVDRLAALRGSSGPPARRGRPTSRIGSVPRAAAIAAGLIVGVVGFLLADSLGPKTYTTVVGGRQIVPLTDGSRVELNTATRLRAVVTGATREVWLDHGEAYFEVRHDGRPFVVHAGAKTISVLGTKFSVRRDGDRVEVAVVEGRVRVADTSNPSPIVPPPVLRRGDIAITLGASTLVTDRSSERVSDELTWRQGKLTFDQETLANVASEFNRYNQKKLVIGDPETAAMRIGGTFEAENVDTFARLLQEAYGLEVEDNGDTIVLSAVADFHRSDEPSSPLCAMTGSTRLG